MAEASTQQQAAAAPQPGTPEYDAAMVAKFENKGVTADPNADPKAAAATTPAKATKPEGLPDKFWNAEKGEVDVTGLAKSYSELEKQRAQPKHEPPKIEGEQPKTDEQKAADQAVQSAGFKMDELSAEFTQHGKLSDDSYGKLEKAGIPRAMVDAYVEGQKALAASRDAALYSAFEGGQEGFAKVSEWAKANVAPADIQAFNKACAQGSVADARLACEALNARYAAAHGTDPTVRIGGSGNGHAGASGFRSIFEMKQAMKDPRYNVDPAYTKDVEQRVGASTAF